MSYAGETPKFKFPYLQDGDTVSGEQEEIRALAEDALFQGLLDAIGVGVIAGGHASIDAGDVALTALQAIIADGTGGVYVEQEAATYLASALEEGDNYIFAQLTATSRQDKSCVYYDDVDPEPAADAVLLCRARVTGGLVIEVDNTVKAPPAIAARIPWELIQRNYDDGATLLADLAAWLGAAYVGVSPPADVDARLTALESGGGGGGGGVGESVKWGALERAVGDPTLINQYVEGYVADAIAGLGSGGGGGDGGVVVVADVPDNMIANRLRFELAILRSVDPHACDDQVNSSAVIWGRIGGGWHGLGDSAIRWRDDSNNLVTTMGTEPS